MIIRYAAALGAIFLSTSAYAQDTSYIVWRGFYAGGSVSFSRMETEYGSTFGVLGAQGYDVDPSAIGIHAGYGRMFGPVYLGFEANGQLFDNATHRDVGIHTSSSGAIVGSGGGNVVGAIGGGGSGSGSSSSSTRTTTRIEAFDTELRAAAALRGRMGYAVGRFMPFVTGGVAVGNFKTRHLSLVVTESRSGSNPPTTTENGEIIALRGPEFGYTVGAGTEIAVTPRFSLRGEYAYTDFADRGFRLSENPGSVDLDSGIHEVRLGMSVYF